VSKGKEKMGWDGMGWDGMGWDGMEKITVHYFKHRFYEKSI